MSSQVEARNLFQASRNCFSYQHTGVPYPIETIDSKKMWIMVVIMMIYKGTYSYFKNESMIN